MAELRAFLRLGATNSGTLAWDAACSRTQMTDISKAYKLTPPSMGTSLQKKNRQRQILILVESIHVVTYHLTNTLKDLHFTCQANPHQAQDTIQARDKWRTAARTR
jgi:hypothetical protein